MMYPNTNNIQPQNVIAWRYPNVGLQVVPNYYPPVPSVFQYRLPHITTIRPCYNLLQQQMPLNLSIASDVQSISPCENAAVSSTHSRQSEEPSFVIGPAFSLADDHEIRRNLQTKNIPITGPPGGHETLSFTDSDSTIQSSSVPPSSLEPQICIGSVFSLADEHTEDTEQHRMNGDINLITTGSSLSQKATEQVQFSAAGQENQQNTLTQDVGNLPKIYSQSTVADSSTSSTSNIPTTEFSGVSKVPQTSLNKIYKNITALLSKSRTPQIEHHVSPERNQRNKDVITPSNLCASRAISQLVQVASSTMETDTTLSHEQQDTNQVRLTPESGQNEALIEVAFDKSCVTRDKSSSYQGAQIMQRAVTTQEPEVVDLDTEDVDDCFLVKIDLSKHFVPFGIKIHNTEVLIHDSDTDDADEDVTGVTSDTEDQNLPVKSIPCSDSSFSSKIVGEKHNPQSAVCSTVVVSENDTCELIGSLNMEVDEINNETDTQSKSTLKQPPPYRCSTEQPPPYRCSTEGSTNSPIVVHQIATLSSRCSVLNSKIDTHVPDKVNSQISNVTGHLLTPPQKSISPDTSLPDCELMELHVDDETPVSTPYEYIKLKVITPSKFSLPDSNLHNHAPEVTKCVSLVSSTSSILSSSTVTPVIPADDQNVFSDAAFQDHTSESFRPHEGIPHVSFSHMTKENISCVNTAKSQKQNLEGINKLKLVIQPKTPKKRHKKGKTKKGTTTNSKQKLLYSMLAESHKSVSHNESSISPGTSPVQAQIESNTCSIMCKLCYLHFPSRLDLVTHTWNFHRHPTTQCYKCKFCDKSFPSSSLLKLHHKIKCTTLNKQPIETRTVADTENSLVQNLRASSDVETLKKNTTSQCGNLKSILRKGCIDHEESLQLNISEHNYPKKNKDPCNKQVSFVKSERYVISANESLLGSEPQIDSHKQSNMRLNELDKLSTHSLVASNNAEQEDVEPEIESLQESACGSSNNAMYKCSNCQTVFESPSDKQAHLSLSKSCWLNEMRLMKGATISKENIEDYNDQDRAEVKGSALTHTLVADTLVAAHAFEAPQQNEENPNIVCPECKENFETKTVFLLHLSDCRKNAKRLLQLSGYKKPAMTWAKKTKWKPSPIQEKDRQDKVSVAETPGNVSTGQILQCMICKTEFSSHGELLEHYIEKTQCSIMQALNDNLPKAKKLKIDLNPVSVTCDCCNLPFTDDFKLAEHLQLRQACHRSEKTQDIELFSANERIKKLVKKHQPCEIVSGISSSTLNVTLVSTNEGYMSVLEQPLEEENYTENRLNDVNVANLPNSNTQVLNCINEVHLPLTTQQSKIVIKKNKKLNTNSAPILYNSDTTILSDLSTVQVCASDGGCIDENEENVSDLSISDDESDIEAETSANEGDVEYKCGQCSKTFTRQSKFIRHTKSHHSSQGRNIHCKVCTRKFHDVTGLQAHLLQFRYCFIPLTRKLWERKQDPHVCTMCRKTVHSPKDLRKHCFKNMACRLRYVKMVLKNLKRKDGSKTSALSSDESSETEFPAYEIKKQMSDSIQGNSEVSSSVPDCENLQNSNLSILQPNVGHDATVIANCNTPASLKECLNCGKTFNDFLGHLVRQQTCLDFYGIYGNKCPVPLPFCFQCKEFFDSTAKLTTHACKGVVAYRLRCSACDRKFTNGFNFNAHITTCSQGVPLCIQTRKHQDKNPTHAMNISNMQQQDDRTSAPIAKPGTSTSKIVDSAEQSFPCLICDAKFPLQRLLMEHSYQHVDETPLKCDRCDTMFVHYNQFVSHQMFHIRMDKENSILPAQMQSNELPPVLEKFGSPNASQNADSFKDQQSYNVPHSLSVCLFCQRDFPNGTVKVDHISNSPACLGIMRCIVDNKFFSRDPSDNQFYEIESEGSNWCEFCQHNFPDRISHYLHSSCINKLEKAILRFRAISRPTEPLVAKTASKETTSVSGIFTTNNSTISPFIKPHNLYCSICKERFHNQDLLSVHQREKHGQSSDRKSPQESSVMAMIDEPDTLYCLTCSKYLKTLTEVENHKLLCKKPNMVLPLNAAVYADWELPHLRCKICNTNYTRTGSLIYHMISKHSDEANVLLAAAGQRTSVCAICSKNIFLPKLNSHFQEHKTAYLKTVRETSHIHTKAGDNIICIFCNTNVPKVSIQNHLKKHTYSSIFESDSDGTKVSFQRKFAMIPSRSKQKTQKPETALLDAKNNGSAIRCKLCHKICANSLKFMFHYKSSHGRYDPETWKTRFTLIDPLEGKQDFVETSDSLKEVKSACSKKNASVDKTSDKTSVGDKPIAKKSDDGGELGISTHNKKPQFFAQKIAQLRPIGSCKICHRNFVSFPLFRFHLKALHNRYAIDDEKKFFHPVAPLGKKTAHSTSLNPGQQITSFYKTLDTDHKALRMPSVLHTTVSAASSCESLNRVCLICRASFSNASLYQTHLKTHIVQCKITLHDLFGPNSMDDESEPDKEIEIIENFLEIDVDIKDENYG